MDADAPPPPPPPQPPPPPILLPCAICARTFMPQSLEKHTRICERAAEKKRKPFDSAKQRIQGTELAEFLPKEVRRHHQDERTTRSSWKKTHDDFLRTIREARGDTMDSHKQCNSLISSGAPRRANEKGTCPTCSRQFGIKAYDRHVAWCKDRVTRMPVSLATNLAKERLEARIRYRAPALKNRRAINREKYSPGSAANQAVKTSVSAPTLVKPKDSITSVNSNRESSIKQKSTVVRRPAQLKSGPMKSRLADRMNSNRPEEDHDSLLASTPCRSFHPATSSHRPLRFPVSPARSRNNNPVSSNEITSPVASSRKQFDRNEMISQRIRNDDTRNRETYSARLRKSIVFAKSQGHPRINDITVNDKTLGMTVQSCRIHTDMQKDDQLVTWKQISRKNDNHHADNLVDNNFSHEYQLDLDRLYDRGEGDENKNSMEEDSLIAENNRVDDKKSSDGEIDKMKNDDVTWLDGIQNLNQTYLIRDSEDIEQSEIFHNKWKPIKNSPRVEFYLKDKEVEFCEFDQKKSSRETVVNDGEIEIERVKKELKVSNKNEEDGGTVVSYKVKRLKANVKNIENNRKINSEEIEVIERKTADINSKDEENKPRANYEEMRDTECNIERIERNIEDTKESEKIDCADVSVPDKLNVSKKNDENQEIADKRIIEGIEYTKETKRNLSEPDEIIRPSAFDVMHSVERNISKEKNFIRQNQDSNLKDEIPQRESSICCNNSLEFNESMVTLTSDQSNINETVSLNNNNNQANCNSSPENEALVGPSNSCCNSSDLKGNIKEMSFPLSCRSISREENCERNDEEIEIDEESYNNGLSNIRNKKSKRNSKRSNHKVESLLRNSEITAGNYLNASMNNISANIKDYRQYRRGLRRSDNFENIENNTKDFDTNSDNSCSNDKLKLPHGRSIDETGVTAGEGLRKKYMDSEFDYGSDSTARVGQCNARGADGLDSSIMLTDYYAEKESRCYGNEFFLNASTNFPRRAAGAAKKLARSINSVGMKHRIRENMNLLRDSTDSLISSVEFVELASIRRPEANCAYERETIEIIRPSRQNKMFKDLLDIKDDAAKTRREDSERSYWAKASKISRSRLTSLYPVSHAEFPKSNPRVRILPPVLKPPLINRSPADDRQRNGSLISDEELSSPDSYKPQDHSSKLSNDSAYSSLNRKYSHHGRSANDTIDRLDEDVVPRNGISPTQSATKCKMSKFCHECGQRFPETAKFCCECGVRRLAL